MSSFEKENDHLTTHPTGVPSDDTEKPNGVQGMEKGSLFRDAKGRLIFEMNGVRHEDVKSIRMFPITDPDHWMALCDKEGNEIVCIEDVETLPSDIRELVREDLQAREFAPVIKKVISISVATDPSEWHVITDHGKTSFTLNDEDDIHRLSDFRILVIDSHGIRYLIPDIRQMDSSSRRILSNYI